ncbi:MAG: DinB family protein [Jatrophihabitans sp.]|uniref:DinB family protein n=1 Tax=Jatrophihabitans sp. TaxID=1932789 RepID=UPI003F7DBBEC
MTTLPKDDLQRALAVARDAVVWKLEGLGEYDVRRPVTPTGTNLLGLVKHLANVEVGYFGPPFGRPFGEPTTWDDPGAALDDDLWARADETRDDIVGLYRRACAHTDATVAALPLEAEAEIPWWPSDRRRTTLHRLLVHVIAETNRHAGHADIVRETIDGAAGLRAGNPNLTHDDPAAWQQYVATVERAARDAAGRV